MKHTTGNITVSEHNVFRTTFIFQMILMELKKRLKHFLSFFLSLNKSVKYGYYLCGIQWVGFLGVCFEEGG